MSKLFVKEFKTSSICINGSIRWLEMIPMKLIIYEKKYLKNFDYNTINLNLKKTIKNVGILRV